MFNTVDSKKEEVDSERMDLPSLTDFMDNYWLKIIELRTKEEITEMLYPLKPEICRYLINLAENSTDQLSEKIRSIVTALEDV